ncbi:hypothetical protein SKAU_G00125990 [Synaphobranchus kaupii]|uniref:Uncharacterized protein n=1 Tax=Synaphobranchus kaupii TaxID=118154 RepID=A0A9Q1J2W4_SYNKA|nr:hypothetical protein SKAU_G00125990 [Synaphobranchus kaupii]
MTDSLLDGEVPGQMAAGVSVRILALLLPLLPVPTPASTHITPTTVVIRHGELGTLAIPAMGGCTCGSSDRESCALKPSCSDGGRPAVTAPCPEAQCGMRPLAGQSLERSDCTLHPPSRTDDAAARIRGVTAVLPGLVAMAAVFTPWSLCPCGGCQMCAFDCRAVCLALLLPAPYSKALL